MLLALSTLLAPAFAADALTTPTAEGMSIGSASDSSNDKDSGRSSLTSSLAAAC